MKLKELLKDIKVLHSQNIDGVDITDVEYFSADVKKGNLFFCIKGAQFDGCLFIDEALNNGAIGCVVTPECLEIANKKISEKGKALIVVQDTVHAVSKMSANFYKYPSRKLVCIGITGTNGKTSITYMLESVLHYAKKSCGVIGTVSYRYNGKEITNIEYTTPKSLYLHRTMKTMLDESVTHLAMEVSSHSVEMGRVSDIDFDVAVFTNLTQDHLDYHKTMENYFQAKRKFFTDILGQSSKKNKYAVINTDCEYGARLAEILKNECKQINTVTIGFNNEADFFIKGFETNTQGSAFTLVYKKENLEFKIPFVGKHNIYNAVSSIAVAISALKIDVKKVKEGLSSMHRIPGRLDRAKVGFNVFVDYAHTDDALKNVISSLKTVFPDKKLTTIFGCGGNRDKGKRPRMGAVATTLSDFTIVTSDNPRFEEPQDIINDIKLGLKGNNYKIVVDRQEAINDAISSMNPQSDVVLIAGKGHEDYQEIKGVKHHFDDREIANKALDSKGRG